MANKKHNKKIAATSGEEQVAEITDLRAVWRRKKRLKRLGRVVAVLLIAFLALTIGVYWEDISHWFATTGEGESLLVAGSGWPQTVQGTKATQVLCDKDRFLVVTDLSAMRLDAKNRYHSVYAHAMANPTAQMSGDWTAIWSVGSTAVKLYSPKKLVYTQTTQEPVLSAAVSQKGHLAVATLSDRYNTLLQLFNQNNQKLMEYSTKQQVTAMDFAPSGKKLVVAELGTNKGEIFTRVSCLTVGKDVADWRVDLPGVMPLAVQTHADASVTLLGDEKAVQLTKEGQIAAQYAYAGELTDYAFGQKGEVALAMTPAGDAQSARIALLQEGVCKWTTDLEGSAEGLQPGDDLLVVTTAGGIYGLSVKTGDMACHAKNTQGAVGALVLDGKALAVFDRRIEALVWDETK